MPINLTFTSSYYFIFAIVVAILYFIVPKYKWIVLLIASILFYATWGVEKIPFILVSAFIAFIAAKYITKKSSICDEKIKQLSENPNNTEEVKKLRITTKKN